MALSLSLHIYVSIYVSVYLSVYLHIDAHIYVRSFHHSPHGCILTGDLPSKHGPLIWALLYGIHIFIYIYIYIDILVYLGSVDKGSRLGAALTVRGLDFRE